MLDVNRVTPHKFQDSQKSVELVADLVEFKNLSIALVTFVF